MMHTYRSETLGSSTKIPSRVAPEPAEVTKSWINACLEEAADSCEVC